jgi:DNA-binding NarL/FixJ family response regulator
MGGEPDSGVPRPREAPSPDETPASVLVCDDHEVLRHGLRAVLRWAPDLHVVAEAGDAAEALVLAAELRPEVTLVGLGTGGAGIPELVRALSATGTAVLLLGEAGTAGDLVEALRAGARGYLHTTVSSDRLVEGVRAVLRGETLLDAAVTGELLTRLDGTRPGALGPGGRNPLTARQQAVSELVAEGLTNAEIATRLQVSRATVKGHITVALRRLNLRDRTQLAIHVNRSARPGAGWEAGPVGG